MKKFISMVMLAIMMMVGTVANAQTQSNYCGSSKFTDNWSATLQGGVVSPMTNLSEKSFTDAIIVLGVDKYINPWLGVGLDGRTVISTGKIANTHVAFDAVNVSGNLKFNLANIFTFDGRRKWFEPVLYGGLGWGHATCEDVTDRNWMTSRIGLELNFNLGKKRAFGLVLNPSVVWGDIINGKLNKNNGHVELAAGIVYHFKTSNGTHGFTKAVLYDKAEVDKLNASIASLKADNERLNAELAKKPDVVKTTVIKEVNVDNTTKITFEKNSTVLSDGAKAALNRIAKGSTVSVVGTASPEGTTEINTALSEGRAKAVADYLSSRGVNVISAVGGEAGRAAIVTVQ